MPVYLTQAKYAPTGVQGLIKEGAVSRRAAVTKMIEQAGGKVTGFWFALGETDLYVTAEYTDRAAAIALSLAVNASGAASCTQVELLSAEDMDVSIGKLPKYRAPGA
jgi:uncharacterized protein with GYD domain